MTEFDLFRTTPEGTEWIATFLDIEVAKFNAKSRAAQAPGEYFVVDQLSGSKLFELNAANSGAAFIDQVLQLTKTALKAVKAPHN
jgi:hypothetical protein